MALDDSETAAAKRIRVDLQLIADMVKPRSRVLDIGCGDGKITADVSRFVKEGEVLGIDPSLAMIEWAKKQFSPHEYPNLRFQLGGFLSPSLESSFDLIYSTAALQHCMDQLAAFKNLAPDTTGIKNSS